MANYIYFNPLDTACKSITGAIKRGEILQFNVFCLQDEPTYKNYSELNLLQTPLKDECIFPTKNLFLHINRDNEQAKTIPMQKTSYGWTLSLSIEETGLYYYVFKIEREEFISCGGMETGCLTWHPCGFLLTVYSEDYKTPDWFKGGVLYQIFPDRFCKQGTMPDVDGRIKRENWGGEPYYLPNAQGKVLNNDFFGGNFKGIASKLPYLKDLGVTTIYLNPIFEAASNHRYDTSDYMKIDPFLGTEEDFATLVNKAKEHDIRIILDGVFNHTGDDSVYFNKYGHYSSVGAYQSKDSPYYTWFSFQDFPKKYESWWGIDVLPEVNEESAEYQNFIFGKGGVLKKWLSFGIAGYRLDVADELPDFFLKKLRDSVKESNPNAIIIGEVWEDASNKIAYAKRREYLQGHELDSVMNYPLKDAIISFIQTGKAVKLLTTVRALINHYPKQTLDCLMNILGTHDTVRILTVLGGIYCKNKDEMASKDAFLSENAKKIAINKLKMAAVLQFTLPGVPCIYYGDENGMEGHVDPFCRRCFDWEHLNEDLISFYKTLGKLRKQYKTIFKDGQFEEIYMDGGLLFFKRRKGNRQIYVYVNNSSKRYEFKISNKLQDFLSGEIYTQDLKISPNAYGVLIEKLKAKNSSDN